MRIGVDTGGTFTDIVAVDTRTGAVATTKTPSTPSNPADGFLAGIHKVANRITVGVVIAALLLSSSLIMRYPGKEQFAMIGYVIAAVAAVYLIVSTLVKDHRDEERAKIKGK